MAEVKPVRYSANGEGPRVSLRGWDDGSVFVDIRCVCGREIWDDQRPLEKAQGWLAFRCERCGRRYHVSIVAVLTEPDAEREP